MNTRKKICLIGNIASHYREPIYRLMERELDCDFYFGDNIHTPIAQIEEKSLHNFKARLKNKFFSKFYWQTDSVGLIRKPYQYYIMDGEPYCLSSWAILLLSKLYGKKTLAWTHGWYGRESWIKRFIKKVFYALHDYLMVYNEYAIDLMIKEGVSARKMYCIANSLDTDAYRLLRQQMRASTLYEQHFHNSYPVIIYCGRIQKNKQLELLIDAMVRLKKENIKVNAVFVGEDVEGVHLDAYAEAHHISSQIWLYGACYDHAALSQLFYDAMVCVSPGNVGLTAIHALSLGCPVITHDNFPYQRPEFEAIIPPKTGEFFEQNNVDDLTEKIKKWTALTPEKRQQVRQWSYDEIDKKWNIYYQINQLKKVLNEK